MSRSEHPLIAVNGLLVPGEKPKLSLHNRYAEAILQAGGLPLAIPPVGGREDWSRLADSVDGFLLTGGDDFTTEPLGLGPTHPAADRTPIEKQELDLSLARLALERGIPVLGICYGMQALGLCEGAEMFQHLPEDRPKAASHSGGVQHDVLLGAKTKLRSILGVERVEVISRHHQALSTVRAPWRVCAQDPEELIEAIERDGHPFALGVQWHPELDLPSPDSVSQNLFRALVEAAKGFHQKHRSTSCNSPVQTPSTLGV